MADWIAFGALVAVVVAVLLVLSAGEQLASSDDGDETGDGDDPLAGPGGLSWKMLLVNALVVHGLVAAVLLAGAAATAVPFDSFGLPSGDLGLRPVLVGLGIGLALYVANEVVVAESKLAGLSPDERVREAIAPDTPIGWILTLTITLPLGAAAEELLFRGVLIGALSTGFGAPVWLLAVVSSGAFGVAHSAQGAGGILVTALLGGALAVVFVVTGSLLVAAVAHYVVNVLEIVLHEGLDLFDDDSPAGA
ncbi:CPBP family intramembrane metalloprotease [Halobacteriales archaeon QS_1_68_20]|nr:MAG: CPBP family intramembrane metalloprotease [Halobacteriales archaeon QS_1_68_20]